MADIAEIGFKADSDELVTAKKRMEDLSPAAGKAQTASEKLSKTMGLSNKSLQVFTTGLNKAVGVLKVFALGAIAFGAAMLTAFSFEKGITSARELSAAVAELSTLLPLGSKQLGEMQNAARGMADEFGTNAAFQIKAFYQAVSAGASTTADAMQIVDTANKLAIGGITDVATGVDILTTATNAYAAQGLKAADASDALFTGMKDGKTTVGELSSGLGQVIPIAASLGVKFDDLVAGVAALTLQGLSTSSAITSLRAILAAVAKPASEASKIAKQLGIEFNTTALRSKGLQGFLEDVIKKTGGSADKLSVLFGSVEALNGALALSGAGGEKFNSILQDMTNKAGATDEAYRKVADSLDKRLTRALAILENKATDVGTILLGAIVPVIEAVAQLVNGTSPLIPILQEVGITFAIAFSPAILATIWAMVAASAALAFNIGVTLATALYTAAAAALAFTLSNPFTAILYALPIVIAAIYVFRDAIGNVLGVDLPVVAKSGANALIGAFVGGYNAIVAVWSALPGALGDIAIQTANNVINAIKRMVNDAVATINQLTSNIPKWLGGGSLKIDLRLANGTDSIANQFKGQAAEAGKVISSEFSKALNTDYIGKFSGEAKGMTDELKIVPPVAAAAAAGVSNLGNTLGGAGGAAGKTKTAIEKLNDEFTKLSEPFNQTKTAFDTLKSEFDNGIITNDQYISSLARLQDAFNATGGTSAEWAKIVGKNTDDISSKMQDLAKGALTDLGDEFINLAVDGKANFEDLAKSVVKSLLKIAWQALIVKPLLGFFGLKDGGVASMGGLSPFAKGDSFGSQGVQKFASGSAFANKVYDSPTMFAFAGGGALGVMGEAGPEAVMPLKRGPDGVLGVRMHSATGGSGSSGKGDTSNSVHIENHYTIAGAVSEQKIIAQIQATAAHTEQQVKQKMVGWLNQYSTDGAMS
jgi:TP901 family phage tail tape measure protein/lambda family phage tail tape measure protein